MAQWVKALIMQVNDLSSILRTHKKLYAIVCICNLSSPTVRWETKRISQKFTGQLACSTQKRVCPLTTNSDCNMEAHIHAHHTHNFFKIRKKEKERENHPVQTSPQQSQQCGLNCDGYAQSR